MTLAHGKEKIMAKKPSLKGSHIRRPQTFAFSAPDAMSVQLVGDFTQWQERPINLQKGVDGVWRITVQLSPGTHHYRFLVDGQWRDDPDCVLRAPNPFGGENMMRQVA
jgi:1,4-alpha-glucan branching enzyme